MIATDTRTGQPNAISVQMPLSDIGVKFIEVRPEDLEACAKFIRNNPNLLDEADAAQRYSSMAVKAFEKGNQVLGRNCVRKGAMVTHCSRLTRSEVGRFFRLLERGDNSTATKFYAECDGREREISYRVQDQARARARNVDNSPDLTLAALQRVREQATTSDGGSDASTVKALAVASMITQIHQTPKPSEGRHISKPKLPSVLGKALSQMGLQFVDIHESQYEKCYKFLTDNAARMDFTEDQLKQEAERALSAGRRRVGKRCIQRALLLRIWEQRSDSKSYFRKLQAEDSAEMAELLKSLDQILRSLEAGLSSKSMDKPGRNVSPRPAFAGRRQSASTHLGAVQKDDRRTFEPQEAPSEHTEKRGGKVMRDRDTPTLPLPDMSRPASRDAKSLPDSSHLDARYQIQRSAFYTFGRVFALVWHEAAHRHDQDVTCSIESARFVEPVFSYQRRMIVVKPGHGFCWCVPISTYGGRGLSKVGLTQEDIAAHAVIHVEDDKPRLLPSEPTTRKRPITMIPAAEDQHLNSPTCVNFAKVYTIEHHSRSMNVGKVSQNCLSIFRQYFEEQLKLE